MVTAKHPGGIQNNNWDFFLAGLSNKKPGYN